MPRVKSNVARLKRKNKVMALAKGYSAPNVRLEAVVRFGYPSDEIVRFAEKQEIDVVVMATRARGG